jgi:hypothetical protein
MSRNYFFCFSQTATAKCKKSITLENIVYKLELSPAATPSSY